MTIVIENKYLSTRCKIKTNNFVKSESVNFKYFTALHNFFDRAETFKNIRPSMPCAIKESRDSRCVVGFATEPSVEIKTQ